MFEPKLKKISKDVFKNKNLRNYFILTHKKHHREMYFQSGDKKALNFAKPKFNSFKKRIIFFLLKLGVLQPILKQIKLSQDIGQLIFVGGQIKGFDLKDKVVNSFHHIQGIPENFIKDKEVQLKLGKQGFAPKIINIDKQNNFSQEELFFPFLGNSIDNFNELLEFYDSFSYQKVKTTLLLKKIKNYLIKNKINESLFNQAIEEIKKTNYFLFTKIHGDFAKEQCLINNHKIFFVDWNLKKGLVTEDLVNYFRFEKDYFNTKEFKIILKKYPLHVLKNLEKYLMLTELLRITQGIHDFKLSKKRINNLLFQK